MDESKLQLEIPHSNNPPLDLSDPKNQHRIIQAISILCSHKSDTNFRISEFFKFAKFLLGYDIVLTESQAIYICFNRSLSKEERAEILNYGFFSNGCKFETPNIFKFIMTIPNYKMDQPKKRSIAHEIFDKYFDLNKLTVDTVMENYDDAFRIISCKKLVTHFGNNEAFKLFIQNKNKE